MAAKRHMTTVERQKPNSPNEARRKPMAIILRGVPPGYNWGFFSREDPRMHLQVVSRKHLGLRYKVWLESKGRRVFEPAAAIPAQVLKTLQAEVELALPTIEAEWVHCMIKKGWLRFTVRGPTVTLIAYPDTPNRLERIIDLRDYLAPEFAARIQPSDVVFNEEFAAVALYPGQPESRQHHIPVAPVLWGQL